MNNCSLGTHQHSSVPMHRVRCALRHGGLHRRTRTHRQSSQTVLFVTTLGSQMLRLTRPSAMLQKHLQMEKDRFCVAQVFVAVCRLPWSGVLIIRPKIVENKEGSVLCKFENDPHTFVVLPLMATPCDWKHRIYMMGRVGTRRHR